MVADIRPEANHASSKNPIDSGRSCRSQEISDRISYPLGAQERLEDGVIFTTVKVPEQQARFRQC